MSLDRLQQVVAGDARIAVVQAQHQADRDLVRSHWVEEAAAELAILRGTPQRPAHRVDHPLQRPLHAPDLLDGDLAPLRDRALQTESAGSRLPEVTLGTLGEDRRARHDVAAGLKVGKLLPLTPASLIARADAYRDLVVDEQLDG